MRIIRFLRSDLSLTGVLTLTAVLFALCGGLSLLVQMLS